MQSLHVLFGCLFVLNIIAVFSQTANATQLFEILGLEGEINLAVSKLAEWAAPRPVNKNLLTIADDVYIQPEPLGVVLIIGAWNYPIAVTLQPLVGAIAAGKAPIFCLLRLSICHVIITMFKGKKNTIKYHKSSPYSLIVHYISSLLKTYNFFM